MKIYLTQELLKALPSPDEGQSEKEWISSCMSHEKMKTEFPEKDQRVAVCYSQWESKGKTKKSLPVTLGGMFKAWSAAAREAAAASRRAGKGQVEETTATLYANRPSRKLARPMDWKKRMGLGQLLEPHVEKLPAEALIRRRASYLDSAYYQRQLAERVARDLSPEEKKLRRDYINKRATKSLTGLFKAWSPEARAAAAEARRYLAAGGPVKDIKSERANREYLKGRSPELKQAEKGYYLLSRKLNDKAKELTGKHFVSTGSVEEQKAHRQEMLSHPEIKALHSQVSEAYSRVDKLLNRR